MIIRIAPKKPRRGLISIRGCLISPRRGRQRLAGGEAKRNPRKGRYKKNKPRRGGRSLIDTLSPFRGYCLYAIDAGVASSSSAATATTCGLHHCLFANVPFGDLWDTFRSDTQSPYIASRRDATSATRISTKVGSG